MLVQGKVAGSPLTRVRQRWRKLRVPQPRGQLEFLPFISYSPLQAGHPALYKTKTNKQTRKNKKAPVHQNSQRLLVLPGRGGAVSVDCFSQQRHQGPQKTDKDYGAQSDCERHVPCGPGVRVFPADLVDNPGLGGQGRGE